MESVEKECGALGGLFQAIVNDMKCSYPVWEDFSAKATKLHSQLRTTVLAAVAFLDAFQKVADMATNTRGATRDIGSALTRMCMRHRSIEAKLRQFTNALMESLICPLQDRIEDWKKTANQLDKDHAKVMWRPIVIKDLKGSDYSWSYQTPPSSPSSSGSRKSSMCSSVNSAHSSASRSSGGGGGGGGGGSQPHSPTSCSSASYRHRSGLSYQPPPPPPPGGGGGAGCIATHRLSSVSSHDSGFVSQDANDWSKAGQYEQPVAAAAVQRRKEPLDRLREQESATARAPTSTPRAEARMHPATIAAKHGEEVSPAASDLAMVLTRGLSMEQQQQKKSSRDSLQYSSGYSTQTNTPSCSEDTIPSQDYDCYSVNGDTEAQEAQSDFDKSSTIPRHSNIAQNYRRMIQTKRPASTAGLPSGGAMAAAAAGGGGGALGSGGSGGGGGGGTPGTATIRRTPSTKPGVRRTLSSAGPIPIRPPIVPVKTPTVPGEPHLSVAGYPAGGAGGGGGGGAGGSGSGGVPVRVGSEECVFFAGAEEGHGALDYMIAANRHSLVEKIGELVASAHALGEGQFPFPLPDDPESPGGGGSMGGGGGVGSQGSTEGPAGAGVAAGAEGEVAGAGGDMLTTIRRGVRLRKTVSNDRSAPRIL
ncbi:hypothetical protein CRUP_033521 [Coryphaenoides rupestris]|nr:hypothetical protein CRUP_033521 [Coryphaenoides rupestris]